MLITRDVQNIGLHSEDADCNGAATGSYIRWFESGLRIWVESM